MSTHLLDTGGEDYRIAVARHVGKLLSGEGQESALARTPGGDLVEAAIAAMHDNEALAGLLLPHVPLVLEKAAPADTEAVLSGLAHTIAAAAAPAAVARLATQLVDALAANTGHRAGARVSGMLEMFNTVSAPGVKHTLVLKILEYARAARIGSLAASLHGKAEAWERQWGLEAADAAELFAAIAAVLEPHPSPILKREAFTLRTKVLLGGAASEGASRAAAHASLLAFVANGALFVCDCFPAPAVQALRGDAEAGAAYELVSVMLRGDVPAFRSGDYSAVFTAAETTEAAVLEKIRMMALVTACAGHEGEEVAFATVQEALQVESGDAEAWIVRAFGKQLLDGRIDQVQETVHVRRCERLVFDGDGWERLQRDLTAWHENLAGISVTMKESTLLTPTSTVQRWLSA